MIWCQGFSEPDAGSDLASLTTRATAVEGGWSITGQKIWTSYAGMAQWCVLAARVDPGDTSAKKHDGITLFLVPMDTPGIIVRPIRSSLGPHHLNEVFFDDVVVEADDTRCSAASARAGRSCATRWRSNASASPATPRCDRLLSALEAEFGDGFDRLARDRARDVGTRASSRCGSPGCWRTERCSSRPRAPRPTPPPASPASPSPRPTNWWPKRCSRRSTAPSLRDGRSGGVLHGAVEDHWRYAQAATVASGTIEIQRMIVGRATLGRA